MVSNIIWQWIFTSVFTGLTVYFVYKLLASIKPLELVSHLLHTLMSLSMLAMSWSWWVAIPPEWQFGFFAAATVWYLMIIVLLLRHKISAFALGGHGIFHQLAHTIMMFSMAWMVFSMLGGDHSNHGGGVDHSMMMSPPVMFFGVFSTAALLVAFIWFLLQLGSKHSHSDSKPASVKADMIANAIMCLGMASMNLIMIF